MPGLSLVAKGVEDAKVQSAVSMSLRARVLEMLAEILAAPDPKTAKAFGRKVAGFDQKVWNRLFRQDSRRVSSAGPHDERFGPRGFWKQ